MNKSKYKKICSYYFCLVFLVMCVCSSLHASYIVESPDRRITVVCDLRIHNNPYPSGQRFYFSIQYNGITVLQDSPIGLVLANEKPLCCDFRIFHVSRDTQKQFEANVTGPSSEMTVHYNEAVFRLQERNPPFRLFNIIFRVSNEGAAFRYGIPQQSGLSSVEIKQEQISFYLPADYNAFALPVSSNESRYEAEYHTGSLNSLAPNDLIGLPLLMQARRHFWMAITEAAVTDYAGLYLQNPINSAHMLNTVLAPYSDNSDVKVRKTLPFVSPWRVILLAEKPGDLIESHFVYMLNEPSPYKDLSWIKPGKCLSPGWSGRHTEKEGITGGLNTQTLVHYMDFAAENGFEYVSLDAGWYGNPLSVYEDVTTSIPDIDLPGLISRGKEQGVGLFLWLSIQNLQDQMEKAFSLYQKWGISGIIVDHIKIDDQLTTDLIHNILKKAAANKLLVILNGALRPSGLNRTYPHLLTSGAVLNAKRFSPDHAVTLPFTRMLAGPMNSGIAVFSHSNGHSSNSRGNHPEAAGTRSHQLARFVVFDSPIQMLPDPPAVYMKGKELDFIKNVPVIWDETRVLKGEPGEYIVIMRRKDNAYYLGAMTNRNARNIVVPLDFLPDGLFNAVHYSDSAERHRRFDPQEVIVTRDTVNSSVQLKISLAGGGGYAARFEFIQE